MSFYPILCYVYFLMVSFKEYFCKKSIFYFDKVQFIFFTDNTFDIIYVNFA